MTLSHDERVRRLKTMLGQVAGEGGLEAIKARTPSGRPESMAERMAGADPLTFVVQSALEKLKNEQTISPAEAGALEAIILPDKRPVVFIRGGVYDTVPMGEWSYLNAEDVQKRVNASFTSIGRIELPLMPSIPYGGTGFVVGPHLLMTNRHVARLFAEGVGTRLTYRTGGSAIDFQREVDAAPIGSVLAITDVVMIHPYWDMALLKVAGLPATAKPLSLSVTSPEELVDQDVVVVGYPAQDYRNALDVQNRVFAGTYGVKRLAPGKTRRREKIVSFENTVNAMTHDGSTLGGNSGSAIIHVTTGKVVGLHFAGEYLKANYCVPMYELARDRRVVDAGLNFEKSVALTNDWQPAWSLADGRSVEPSSAAVEGRDGDAQATTRVPGTSPASPDVRASATLNLVIPIQVAVTVETSVSTALPTPRGLAIPSTVPEVEVEKVPVIFPDLSSREGYRPDFLDLANGNTAPLPVLTAAGQAATARLDDGSFELKYHRFSIVMHKRRRLALFTASNVDWREKSRRVGWRKPGRKELDGFTGNEREDWVIDPRIPLDHQVPDYFYKKDGGTFDKGHLVRRDDVAWGDSFADMQKGNGDTFHTTNCTPQTAKFNRPAELNWGALEQMVQKQTATEKVCIFSGPVLAEDDQYFHGFIKSRAPVSIQLPRKFWKIIVTNAEGAPAAFGFVLDHDLSGVDLYAEMTVPDAWKDYLRPISEIESYLNGLAKFTALEPWDQYGKL